VKNFNWYLGASIPGFQRANTGLEGWHRSFKKEYLSGNKMDFSNFYIKFYKVFHLIYLKGEYLSKMILISSLV